MSTRSLTIKTAPHGASNIRNSAYVNSSQPSTDAAQHLKRSCPKETSKDHNLLQSSLTPHLSNPTAPVYPSTNGFVHSVITAYNHHHHLTLRPEDIWFAILTQFSSYVNAHAESLRGKFVAHEGKQELVIDMPNISRHAIDFGRFAEMMGMLLEKSVVDDELRAWILPSWSTTQKEDEVVASILMMGTLQNYFSYTCRTACGIPSVTLLGTEGDWENILLRLEKLRMYGDEPNTWCDLLTPILRRFVESFRHPESKAVLGFWQRIVHESRGSGYHYLSGWISAFCFWNEDGKMRYHDPGLSKKLDPRNILNMDSEDSSTDSFENIARDAKVPGDGWTEARKSPFLVMDGARYSSIDIKTVPQGYSSVPVKLEDNGEEIESLMVAGSIGIKGRSSGKAMENGDVGLDSLQPVSGWGIFEKLAAE